MSSVEMQPVSSPATDAILASQAAAARDVVLIAIKDLHYGSFRAVRDTTDSDPEARDHRVHRTSGCGRARCCAA